ncbi:hypothetical protein [Agaribacterium haliotis]|uniref:hypothetical protein n=1 Tax=Agaribacterium haliotis TaxID=2013869 RepID=UPI000BB59AFD|nr:hypothetical protein [Agaribacterium haliotis]
MSNEKKIKREKGASTDGKTDYERLKNMTEEEVEDNAKSDPDAPLLSDEDLKKFKRVNVNKD